MVAITLGYSFFAAVAVDRNMGGFDAVFADAINGLLYKLRDRKRWELQTTLSRAVSMARIIITG
ncbi:hypothetical protein D3C81_2036950 [compost metagenome]